MKIAFSKMRYSLSRALRPMGFSKIPVLNLLFYEVTPERERLVELGRQLYKLFPEIRASINFGHSGGTFLEALLDKNLFVLEYLPGEGYGVTSRPEPFTIGAERQFDTFEGAQKHFLDLLRGENRVH